MIVPCPRCGKRVPFEGNPFRPFCSERCKLIDLGNWVSGVYRAPGPADPSSGGEPADDEPAGGQRPAGGAPNDPAPTTPDDDES